MENIEDIGFVNIEGKETKYDEIYYIKCGKGEYGNVDFGNGYEGYAIQCKIYTPNEKDYGGFWVSLKKIKDGVFEVTDTVPLALKYVSNKTVDGEFEIICDIELNKIYGDYFINYLQKFTKQTILPSDEKDKKIKSLEKHITQKHKEIEVLSHDNDYLMQELALYKQAEVHLSGLIEWAKCGFYHNHPNPESETHISGIQKLDAAYDFLEKIK